MVTRIVSFGFKYGTPVDADVVLDVRFLDNPYFVPGLKTLTGRDEPVARYVLAAPETQEFLRRTRELLEYVMPKYEREGKSYLTIAIGCTGGRHRSVAIAEALARDLSASTGASVAVVHRDPDRGQGSPHLVDLATGPSDAERLSVLELKGVASGPPSAGQAERAATESTEEGPLPRAGGGRS
jgi:UPF0042 nucleotide-binding protein